MNENLKNFFETVEPIALQKVYDEPDKHGYSQYLEIVKSRLPNYKIKTLLDVGCGEATPMIEYLKMGYDVRGIDYSDNALKMARDNLKRNGYDPSLVIKYDITNDNSLEGADFDCINCIGVLPHIREQKTVISSLASSLKNNGVMFLQFRNLLFSMFSLNQYTSELFKNYLIPYKKLNGIRNDLDVFLKKKLATKVINIDNIYHNDSNPLTINELFESVNLKIIKKHFAHYHALPPIFEETHPDEFHKLSKNWKDCQDWRGNFMCSSFIMEVQKVSS